MKLIKVESLDLNESLSEVEDKAREVINPVFANASKEIAAADEKREQAQEIPESEEPEEKAENPKMTPGAKKMHLDESLFEDYEEEGVSDIILVISEDETEDYQYRDEYQADAHFEELRQMSDKELSDREIIGYAHIWRNDEDKFELVDAGYAEPTGPESKVNDAIDEYLNQINGLDEDLNRKLVNEWVNPRHYDEVQKDASGRIRPKTYNKRPKLSKPVSLQVYDNLEDSGYEVFASDQGYGYEISKKYEKNLDKAKEILNKLGISFSVKPIRDRFYMTINLPDDSEEVDDYFKRTDKLMMAEGYKKSRK